MDDERLSDDERALLVMLDHDLQRELQVVPAPDFLARVRENLAATPKGARTWRTWWMPAAVAATVLIGVLGLLAARNLVEPRLDATKPVDVARVTPAQPVPPRIAQPQATTPISRSRQVTSATPVAPSQRVARTPTPTTIARSVRPPEVLVSPGDERALLRFMALTNAGRIDSSSLDAVFASSAAELVITPITIEPLPEFLPEADKPAGSGPPGPPPAVNALLTGLR